MSTASTVFLILGLIFLLAVLILSFASALAVKKSRSETVGKLEKRLNPWLRASYICTILMGICLILVLILR